MALIKCEECGHMVSDRAEACPNCGAPVNPRDDVAVNEPAKCSECGVQLPDGATECPECGCHVDGVGPEGSLKQTNAPSVEIPEPPPLPESKKMGFSLKLGLAVLATAVILISLAIIVALTEEKRANARVGRAAAEAIIAEWEKEKSLKAVKSVEEARELINGTVWHYTKNTSDPDDQIGFWMKVEFHGDTYTHYRADPSDGRWEKVREGTYEIVEERYSNTGEKYIAVKWDGSETLLPLQISLSLETFRFAATTKELSLPSPDYIYGNIYRTPKPAQTRYGYMELGDYEWR